MNTPQRNGIVTVVRSALGVLLMLAPALAADAPPAAPQPKSAAPETPAKPADEKAAPAADHAIQITGRVLHTWYEKQDLRIILAIDGFTVQTGTEQLKASDGVVWFDEAEAKRTGHATLGVYAESGAEIRRAGGQIERYDSLYVVMENGGELKLNSDVPLRGKVDGAPLYLRAKKQRADFLAGAAQEAPTGVTPPPTPAATPAAPGVEEARVPKEITIVPQDDVRKVNFTSVVEDGMRISVWTGGIYIMRGDMEIAADNLVIWTPVHEAAQPEAAGEGLSVSKPAKRLAAEAYLEGNVQMNMGHRYMWSSQMYYDFERDQALAVNSRIRLFTPIRSTPVIYHAKEVRQLAQNLFTGTDAWMTTCDMAEPHYEMGAHKMTLTDLTPGTREQPAEAPAELGPEGTPLSDAEQEQYRRIRFQGEDVEARVMDFPVAYWPVMGGDLDEGETALRQVRIENRSQYGTGFLSQWHLLKLLGITERPRGFDFLLDMDYWSKRGPAVGIESDYHREDFFGKFRTYYIHDLGKDAFGKTLAEPDTQDRDRVLWRHRQYLPDDWELTMEFSKISDQNFLNEFFTRENQEDKAQETLLYLKKQENDQALTILAAWRLNDFYTRTEYLPQIGHNIIGHSLADDKLTYFEDSELSVVRYREAKTDYPANVQAALDAMNPFRQVHHPPSSSELLADTIHEVDAPINDRGPVHVTPFVQGRATYFEQVLDGSGDQWRGYGRVGARAATQNWRVYDNVESDFWDIHKIRHINTFDVTAFVADTNVPSKKLIPYDVTEAGTPSVEGVDRTGVVEMGWRQRFQTKRGFGDRAQTVDWLTSDLRMTLISNSGTPMAVAPDGSRAHDHLNWRNELRVTDAMTVWTDLQMQMSDWTVDTFSVGTSITHSPRLTYSLGQRTIPDGHAAITFISFDYRINEKYSVQGLEQYNWDGRQNALSEIFITRRLHCWLLRVKLERDQSTNSETVGIELQPMATPDVKFTGL